MNSPVAGTAPARLLVIDNSLITQKGHHFSYNMAIYRAARKRKLPVQFLCHRQCSIEVMNELPVTPLFTNDIYQNLSTENRATENCFNENFTNHGTVFFQDLCEHVSPMVEAGDLVFFHTLLLPELNAIRVWYAGLPEAKRPFLAIVLRFSIREGFLGQMFPDRSQQFYEGILSTFRREFPAGKVHFCTDTAMLADQFEPHCGPLRLLPIPLDTIVPADLEAARPGSPEFLFCGDAFSYKGFPLLLEAIPQVAKACPEARFTVQVTGACCDFSFLRAIPGVRLVEERPLEEDYYAMFQKASALVLPYDPVQYSVRSSHIFVEAVLRGLPVICSDNPAMATELRALGATATIFAPYTAEALAGAMTRFAADPEACRKTFVEQTAPMRAFHTREKFLDLLLECGHPQAVPDPVAEAPARRQPRRKPAAETPTAAPKRTGKPKPPKPPKPDQEAPGLPVKQAILLEIGRLIENPGLSDTKAKRLLGIFSSLAELALVDD